MRVFEHPNLNNFRCPLCGTNNDKPVVLVGIEGTEDGGNMKARQYHLDCIELTEVKENDKTYLIMGWKVKNE